MFLRDLLRRDDPQIEAGLRVLAHVDADVLVLGGIDYDHDGLALALLAERLGAYPHSFQRAPNRGVQTGADLDGDGRLGGADDALGYGAFRGAEGIAVLSRLPISVDTIRDHTGTLWRDLPGHMAPPGTPDHVPVSTTVHLGVPIVLSDGSMVEVITWHATPPVFDGPEDRNGRRNHDEAALALSMLDRAVAPVVIAAFANLDPVDGKGRGGALHALLGHPSLLDRPPESQGARSASQTDGGANMNQRGDPAHDTVDWPDGANRPGNLRVDLLVPDRAFSIARSGVLWPVADAPLGDDVRRASRHRVVWMDLVLNRPSESRDRIGGAEVRQ